MGDRYHNVDVPPDRDFCPNAARVAELESLLRFVWQVNHQAHHNDAGEQATCGAATCREIRKALGIPAPQGVA